MSAIIARQWSAAAVAPARLTVRQFTEIDKSAWDSFVLGHPHGSPFHLTAWKESIELTFGYRSYYLLVENGASVSGVLPLFLVSNFLTGRRLISSPFAVYGGILATTEAARLALVAEAQKLAEELQVNDLELRNAWEDQCSGLPRLSRYVTFQQEIGSDEQAILESIPRKTRAAVRKGLKAGLETREECSDCGAFEELYAQNLRRLGTPCFPRRHFSNLLQCFNGMADIREVTYEGKVVAAVLSFRFRDQLLPYYGASDPAYNAVAPNNFMYFDLMRWGRQRGYRIFDFGRSKKVRGSYDFKSHWGMTEHELPYEVYLVKAKNVPNFTPTNPAFRLPIECWKRLPMALARTLGPLVIRYVP